MKCVAINLIKITLFDGIFSPKRCIRTFCICVRHGDDFAATHLARASGMGRFALMAPDDTHQLDLLGDVPQCEYGSIIYACVNFGL